MGRTLPLKPGIFQMLLASAQLYETQAPRHPQHKTLPNMKHSSRRFTTQPTDATRTATAHPRGFRWTREGLGGLSSQPRQGLSTTSHRTPSDINLELGQRISSSLHCDSARAHLRRVRLTASRDASTTPDDPWPAMDDPGSDTWSTECDSPPDLSDESLTTMVMNQPQWAGIPSFSAFLRLPLRFVSLLRSGFLVFPFHRETPPFRFEWTFSSALQSVGSLGPMSASTRSSSSSSQSSRSELPSRVNNGSEFLNVAYFDTVNMLSSF